MKKAILILLVLTLAPMFVASAYAEGKVGYVDFAKVLELTDKGREVRKQLTATKEELEIQIQEKELELQKMGKDIKDKMDVMSKEAMEAKRNEFQEKLYASQQFVQESNMKFEKLRIKLIRSLVSDMEDVVAQVAKSNGFDLVLMKFEDVVTSSSFVLYGAPSSDLTDKVIQKLNSGAGN